MNELNELGQRVFLGNELMSWLGALLQFALWFTVLPIVKGVLASRLRKRDPAQTNVLLELVLALLQRTTRIFLVVVATFLALQWLVVPAQLDRWVKGALLLVVWVQVALWGSAAVRILVEQRLKTNAQVAKESAASLNILKFVGIAAVWMFAFLLLLSNYGIDVTALIAGLGVGGIAIALAVQNVLGDLLASLSIALDKPFKVGDFLVIGEEKGTVEHIGIKSTRLRSLSGEQIVMSNADLLKSRLRNFGLLYERRILFKLGIIYETPRDRITEVPKIIERAIRAHEKTRFDRAHFAAFGAFSLDYEAVYFVLDPGFATYMDIQQAINLQIHEEFEKLGIEFAYPTTLQYNDELASPPAAEGSAGSGHL